MSEHAKEPTHSAESVPVSGVRMDRETLRRLIGWGKRDGSPEKRAGQGQSSGGKADAGKHAAKRGKRNGHA